MKSTVDTKHIDHLDRVTSSSFPLEAEMPAVSPEQKRAVWMSAFRSRMTKLAKNPLFLVILTWTVMAFLLAFEVVAKK